VSRRVGRIDDRRPAIDRLKKAKRKRESRAGRNLHDFDGDVVPPKAVDQMLRRTQTQLLCDVALDQRRRRCSERDDRRGPERRQVLADGPVIRAEVVSPLGNAVRLVDGHQARPPFGEHLRESSHAQPLRGDEEEVQFSVQILHADFARGGPVAV
jgi:hypothetical protein